MAACTSPFPWHGAAVDVPARTLAIQGTLYLPAVAALPEDAVAVVEVRDGLGATASVVRELRIPLAGRAFPINFDLPVDRERLAPATPYVARAGIVASGRPAWVTEAFAVDPRAATVDMGGLVLEPVAARPFASHFDCGGARVTVGFGAHATVLTAGGETFAMRSVPTPTGPQLVATTDPATIFRSTGATASLTIRGRDWPVCRFAGDATSVYRARGNEPGWLLEITDTDLSVVADYGLSRLTARTPPAGATAPSRSYATRVRGHTLTVAIRPRLCRDTMTGMPYPDTVEIGIDERTLPGCGGDPASVLQRGEWRVEDLNGAGIIDRTRLTLRFDADGRLAGVTACGSFTARYALTGEGLVVTVPAPTTKACAPALLRQDSTFFATLATVERFAIAPDGALRLLGPGRSAITARGPGTADGRPR